MKKYSLIPLLRTLLLALPVSIMLTNCTEDEPVKPQPEVLISYDNLFSWPRENITSLLNLAGYGELGKYTEYDINVFKITYKTSYLNNEVIASGLVTFPETENAIPMMSFQHGTMTKHTDAPTVDIGTYSLLSSFASNGYIFLVPDYIGFGSSTAILHPYYHAESIGRTIIDMLRAAGELADQTGYTFNGEVYLCGYSEGGYATMAAHKAMEDAPVQGFKLVASAPASGGYDIKGMQEYFFSLDIYDDPYYIAYAALSYKNTYGWTEPLTDFFQEPYVSEIPEYFDGSLSGGEINRRLTNKIDSLIQPDLLENIDNDEKYAYIVNAFEENSLDSWIPEIKMFLYHGTADVTVPYQNSVKTYENMISLGASSNILSLTPLEGADHSSGFIPYLIDILDTFEVLKME